MIRRRKSKPVSLAAAFLVGGSGLVQTIAAYGQELDELTVFSGELRRGIDTGLAENFGTTDFIDLGSDTGRRAQLNGERSGTAGATAVPTPRASIPLSPRVQRRATPVSRAPVVFNPASENEAPQQNLPAAPVQTAIEPVVEDEPFEPTGFRLGVFEGNLSLEQTAGYSSNISQNAGGEGGAFSQTDISLGLVSDWSRHELQLAIDGSYRRPFDSEEVDRQALDATLAHRMDLIDGVTLTTAGFYSLQSEEFTSTTLLANAVDTPLEESYGGSIELERADRKLQFTLRGRIEREVFEDADLGGGVVGFRGDLDNNEYGIALRLGYEISPAIVPFVEVEYAIREFDLQFDSNGNQRDSEILTAQAGVSIDLGEKIRGEISAGYVTESFEDPLLDDLRGFILNSTLNWSPERDTLISLVMSTETNNSITANSSGTFSYNLQLLAERQITDRWAVNSSLGYQLETNDDRNTTIQVGVGVEYWLNRFLALTGDVEYETFSSDAANSDFDEFSVRAGIRLQR